MAVLVGRDILDKATDAVHSAIRQCRDLTGEPANPPALTENDVSFAILGAMTMLFRDEVLLDEMLIVPREWPRCPASQKERA